MLHAFRKALFILLRLPATLLLGVIVVYQRTLSPDHGLLKDLYPYGFCRHEPTCSEFAKEVLTKKPLHTALCQITKRVLSCHPWQKPSDEKLKKIMQQTQDLD